MTASSGLLSRSGSNSIRYPHTDPWNDCEVLNEEHPEYSRCRINVRVTSNSPEMPSPIKFLSGGGAFLATSADFWEHILVAFVPAAATESIPTIVNSIRRLTGYSWDKIAELANVSRQTIHKWNNGEPISPQNRDWLLDLYAVLKFIDRGTQTENQAILERISGEVTLFASLRSGQFDFVKLTAGAGSGRRDRSWGKVHNASSEDEAHWVDRLSYPYDEVEIVPAQQASKRLSLKRV